MKDKYNGRVRVHPMRSVYDGVHLDTTMIPPGFNKILGKYICMIHPEDLNPVNISAFLRGQNWLIIECPKLFDRNLYLSYSFALIDYGMNVFVLNPELVLVDDLQNKNFKSLWN